MLALAAAQRCTRAAPLAYLRNVGAAAGGHQATGPASGSGEQPADAAGPLAQGTRMVEQPGMTLQNPADPDAPVSLLQRATEAVQDLLRPLPETRGRAYHYAEDSARAAVAEMQAAGKDLPGIESMYCPTSEEVGDAITAPRNWHFSNRTEEEAQPKTGEGRPDGTGGTAADKA